MLEKYIYDRNEASVICACKLNIKVNDILTEGISFVRLTGRQMQSRKVRTDKKEKRQSNKKERVRIFYPSLLSYT